jgi:hypothetical protein
MRKATLAALTALLVAPTATAHALPPLPRHWPSHRLQLGLADSPGGAAALRRSAPFGFRYQYLAGGVNTGNGWATWNPDGAFVTMYVRESLAARMTPVFTYYMLQQSKPGAGSEGSTIATNLQDVSTMKAFWADLTLFFERAGAFRRPVVLHVEPDLWGYVEQAARADDAATVPAKVGASGNPDLVGLPDTVSGFAQAIVRLRDRYAPNVILAYHLSVWGTKVDIALQDPPDSEVRALGDRAARFYRSLRARFDLTFAEFSDRDSAFKQYIYGDHGASWWNADDFARNERFLSRYSKVAHQRLAMWQIPLGNTVMRAMNDSWGHYQDNRVQWLLSDRGYRHLRRYARAGVIALLFGGGADGTTCACDARHDGVTNPPPIGHNTRRSSSADDDGGYFRSRARAYYLPTQPLRHGGGHGALKLPR